jgi:hypothetical protein
MSIIESIKTYLYTYTGLKSGAPIWVNYLEENPTSYSINPLPGEGAIEEYIGGGSLEVYPFEFNVMESTADEPERLDNIGFFESFREWLKNQSNSGILPTMESGKTPYKIEAVAGAYLYEQGESETGIYQILCQLIYGQSA